MDYQSVTNSYKEIIEHRGAELAILKKNIFRIGIARLVAVLLGLVATYYFWGKADLVALSMLVATVVFLVLLSFHSKLFRKKLYCELQIKNAENELKALDYNFSAFDGAAEKITDDHSYSLDLDLFGNRSFFQSINRTVTSFGKEALADRLLYPSKNEEQIFLQQKAVQELSEKKKLLLHFRAIGQMTEPDKLNVKDWTEVFHRPSVFLNNKFWTSLVYIVPILYLVLTVLYLLGLADGMWFAPLYVTMVVVSFAPMKKVNKIVSIFDKKSAILEKYADLFQIIEQEQCDSQYLKQLQKDLTNSGGLKASSSIKKLSTYYTYLMMSATYPLIFLFCPVLMWHIRYARLIEKWSAIHKDDIQSWFDAMGQFDALVSMASFAYNHPDYTYPQASKTFVFEAKSLGHPLINRAICVKNDVNIDRESFFLVITGANMAGKSTYLRTVGINHTIANMGLPVCADSLTFMPGQLVTNLRTADSLADNESYFFAELKRLKMIIDRLQSGEQLFIILDEILKGTNSEDKQRGSLALMKQLISLHANGIIATHDLLLGTLEKEYPENVKNQCFEADITNNHLTFTYKIREGVAQNMNACFLMRKMGITGV